MKSYQKGIHKALVLGFIFLTPSLQASEVSLDNEIFEFSSRSIYTTTASPELYPDSSAFQNTLDRVLVEQHEVPSTMLIGTVYPHAIASSNSLISSHFKVIAIVKDLL